MSTARHQGALVPARISLCGRPGIRDGTSRADACGLRRFAYLTRALRGDATSAGSQLYG